MLVPPNVHSFYSEELDKSSLFQGDIINAKGIGLEAKGQPDHWIIISKNCDLVLSNNIPRKQNISILPVITFRLLSTLYDNELSNTLSKLRTKIVILAVRKISDSFQKPGKGKLKEIITDKISKYMYLPPDGDVLKEPMIIDFDLVRSFNASDTKLVKKFLKSKSMQLVSPFREKMAQRFAHHFVSIGIDDDFIRDKAYIAEACESFKK